MEQGHIQNSFQDLDGAYSHLIHLQEVNKELKKQTEHLDRSNTMASFQQPSMRMSMRQLINQEPSGVGDSSCHSFPIPFASSAAVTDSDAALASSPEQTPISICRLIALNKLEIPILLLGTIAAVSQGKLIQRIRSMCFEKVVHMEGCWFDEPEHSNGFINARLSADAATVHSLVGDALAEMISNAASKVVALVISFHMSWQLALILLALVPLLGINVYVQVKFMKGFSADAKVFFPLAVAAIGVSQSNSLGSDSTKTRRATSSMFAIIDRKSKIDPSDKSGMTLENVQGEIEFQHVSFKYPLRPDVQIFQDLSFPIPAGKGIIKMSLRTQFVPIALVRESGSGKSTVVSLLQRLYDPDSGLITLDGVEIRKFQVKWLTQQMGLVRQELVLFNDTIRANIAYGKQGNASGAEILDASKLANAHKFISGLHQVRPF
ncbi:hypothetical protein SLEP1_g48208 [Rubroshorea leprosula]|uniref:ABC transmembrane type-1 domain-containing protein n=1 Tax=Rubroshorea leprosula TaxID=152421 RepID=A0AAV5LUU4_9ROSI|nr:hypothetical protein SLEP1_g48208 [Rubroshorea leprosula]